MGRLARERATSVSPIGDPPPAGPSLAGTDSSSARSGKKGNKRTVKWTGGKCEAGVFHHINYVRM